MNGKIHAHLVPREDASGSAAQALPFAVVLDRVHSKRRPELWLLLQHIPQRCLETLKLSGEPPQLHIFRVMHIVERKRITQK